MVDIFSEIETAIRPITQTACLFLIADFIRDFIRNPEEIKKWENFAYLSFSVTVYILIITIFEKEMWIITIGVGILLLNYILIKKEFKEKVSVTPLYEGKKILDDLQEYSKFFNDKFATSNKKLCILTIAKIFFDKKMTKETKQSIYEWKKPRYEYLDFISEYLRKYYTRIENMKHEKINKKEIIDSIGELKGFILKYNFLEKEFHILVKDGVFMEVKEQYDNYKDEYDALIRNIRNTISGFNIESNEKIVYDDIEFAKALNVPIIHS